MLSIYIALEILAFISYFVLLITVKQYYSIPFIKMRIIVTSILLVNFFFQVILSIILKKSVFNNIFCLLLSILYLIITFLNLKEVKGGKNRLENHIISGTDTENEEITEEDAVTEVLTENNNK